MQGVERKVLLGILLGVAVYAALTLWADVGALGQQVQLFRWWAFAAALGLASGNYLIRIVRWWYYLRVLRIDLPRRESGLLFVASLMLTVTPGKVGEVIKSYLLKRSRQISISLTAPIVVAERLTDLLALLFLALLGIGTYTYGVTALFVAGSLIALLVAFVSAPGLAIKVIGWTSRLPLIGRLTPKLLVAYQSMRTLVTPKPLIYGTVMSVAAWLLECVAFYLVIRGFAGAQPNFLAAVFIYSFTTILGAISFLPGGLGVTEGSMSVALIELGLMSSTSMAVAATCIIRLATLWFAVLLGSLAFLAYRRIYLPVPPLTEDPGDRQSGSSQGPGQG
ncbi:MAG: flippase-like domain-containing protein [Bradymonadales bacterium]|nr:flippase-like domain-containing protein [Bradymonadales bacterium]